MADWERFVNDPPRLPALIRCALMHHQFETIHPFLDGNGRVGRLLIILMVIEEGLLSLPLLYVSAFMEQNRREYYERLQAVRETGAIQEWLQFFLTAVEKQAQDAEARAEKLARLRERYRAALKGGRARHRSRRAVISQSVRHREAGRTRPEGHQSRRTKSYRGAGGTEMANTPAT